MFHEPTRIEFDSRGIPAILAGFALACVSCAPRSEPEEAKHALPPPAAASEPLAGSVPEPSMHAKADSPYSMPRRNGQLVVPGPEVLAQLPPDGGEEYNRLIFESSPYLLQHARNPVDWRPFGAEAFAEAKRLNKPVFLSIGYSTCHWCHVMEHESFEDPEIASLMNEAFVCIKVDREERPDVDQVYMSTAQAMTGSGGWPLTVVTTPEARPFFAGTYFPPDSRMGRVGMQQLVPRLSELWETQRERVEGSAEQIVQMVRGLTETGGEAGALDPGVFGLTDQDFRARFDSTHAGFGGAPKFPVPHNLRYLLRRSARTGEEDLATMALRTLEEMCLGGIYDQVGHGFHRYSTDEHWLLPHFEKMLYDQALLVEAYVEAHQLTGDDFFKTTALETLAYVERELGSDDGLFRSAEDADSQNEEGELEEGVFYLWTPEQLRATLEPEQAAFVLETLGVREGGNFIEEATGERPGGSILHFERRLGSQDAIARWEVIRDRLFEARAGRIPPLMDDKRLTDWNGLAIAAFATAGSGLGEPRLVRIAERAADRLLEHLRDPKTGRLFKRSRQGESGVDGVLDDYAFVAHGLLCVYRANGRARYLVAARELIDLALAEFWDPERGGFFLTRAGAEALFTRPRESYDGALPSGSGVMADVLVRLGLLTGEASYSERATETLASVASAVQQAPAGHTRSLLALDLATQPAFEVVLVGRGGEPEFDRLVEVARRSYGGHFVLHVLDETDPESRTALQAVAPFVAGLTAEDGRAAAFVCRRFACEQPVHDAQALSERLVAGLRTDPSGSGSTGD